MSTINSKTSSSSDEEIETTLRSFLEGQTSLLQLSRNLKGKIEFDFSDARREIRSNNLEGEIGIAVEEEHVRRALLRYSSGDISAEELSDWAAFIFLSEVFIPKGGTPEERWQAGEGPVWDILQQLMTPSLFNGLDFEVARDYLEQLR